MTLVATILAVSLFRQSLGDHLVRLCDISAILPDDIM
jgi:hypothetical protein